MTTLWANLVAEAEPERLVTFTNIGETRDEIRVGLQHILRTLRSDGFEFEYWGVVELHVSGKPHMHVVQRGSYIPKKQLAAVVYGEGWGHSDIRGIRSGWSAARYCGKHLCHSHGRRWNGRLIRYSRGFFAETKKDRTERLRDKSFVWEMRFGRADVVASQLAGSGENVELSELGEDWIMGEKKVGDDLVQKFVRGPRLGYSLGHAGITSYVKGEEPETV